MLRCILVKHGSDSLIAQRLKVLLNPHRSCSCGDKTTKHCPERSALLRLSQQGSDHNFHNFSAEFSDGGYGEDIEASNHPLVGSNSRPISQSSSDSSMIAGKGIHTLQTLPKATCATSTCSLNTFPQKPAVLPAPKYTVQIAKSCGGSKTASPRPSNPTILKLESVKTGRSPTAFPKVFRIVRGGDKVSKEGTIGQFCGTPKTTGSTGNTVSVPASGSTSVIMDTSTNLVQLGTTGCISSSTLGGSIKSDIPTTNLVKKSAAKTVGLVKSVEANRPVESVEVECNKAGSKSTNFPITVIAATSQNLQSSQVVHDNMLASTVNQSFAHTRFQFANSLREIGKHRIVTATDPVKQVLLKIPLTNMQIAQDKASSQPRIGFTVVSPVTSDTPLVLSSRNLKPPKVFLVPDLSDTSRSHSVISLTPSLVKTHSSIAATSEISTLSDSPHRKSAPPTLSQVKPVNVGINTSNSDSPAGNSSVIQESLKGNLVQDINLPFKLTSSPIIDDDLLEHSAVLTRRPSYSQPMQPNNAVVLNSDSAGSSMKTALSLNPHSLMVNSGIPLETDKLLEKVPSYTGISSQKKSDSQSCEKIVKNLKHCDKLLPELPALDNLDSRQLAIHSNTGDLNCVLPGGRGILKTTSSSATLNKAAGERTQSKIAATPAVTVFTSAGGSSVSSNAVSLAVDNSCDDDVAVHSGTSDSSVVVGPRAKRQSLQNIIFEQNSSRERCKERGFSNMIAKVNSLREDTVIKSFSSRTNVEKIAKMRPLGKECFSKTDIFEKCSAGKGIGEEKSTKTKLQRTFDFDTNDNVEVIQKNSSPSGKKHKAPKLKTIGQSSLSLQDSTVKTAEKKASTAKHGAKNSLTGEDTARIVSTLIDAENKESTGKANKTGTSVKKVSPLPTQAKGVNSSACKQSLKTDITSGFRNYGYYVPVRELATPLHIVTRAGKVVRLPLRMSSNSSCEQTFRIFGNENKTIVGQKVSTNVKG